MSSARTSKKYNQKQLSNLKKAFREALSAVDDLSPALDTIADHFLTSRRFIFDKKAVSRRQYPELSPIYAKRKTAWKKRGFVMRQGVKIKTAPAGNKPYPILLLTGRLRDSVTKRGGENITAVGRRSLEIGTSVPYGQYHNDPEIKPYRPFLFWGAEVTWYSTEKNVRDLHLNMATTLLIYVQRVTGKKLKASVTAARARAHELFR